ncbi:polysaccharide deacetylase family protein [Fulvivirgaceae bacterium BMA10]|uniref:Polysaccharide deacetylase family protein n=1 Tax=Splendidivirga corallicola TaxID=3051826 RepID=A0ABT8KTG5_9BACT|nr:polysaccharide deacetylase family protein [Fulvivirgaceae bacterium BMA10]
MYLHKTPKFLQYLYPGLVWHKDRKEKCIYITFDDGPVPEITQFALNTLGDFNAKGTFFCVGENISRFPEEFKKVVDQGHSVGNHTFNHMNGWNNSQEHYYKNVERCHEEMKKFISVDSRQLFRPPYGRIKRAQANKLMTNYDIIMWDVLTGDFDHNLDQDTCLKKAIESTRNGSIVIFHDSEKAARNMQFVLPRYLDHFSNLGYTFSAL